MFLSFLAWQRPWSILWRCVAKSTCGLQAEWRGHVIVGSFSVPIGEQRRVEYTAELRRSIKGARQRGFVCVRARRL